MFLVMEILDGGSLLERLSTTGALPLARARTVVKQLCEAVSYLHQCGMIHRDLKPGNVGIARCAFLGGVHHTALGLTHPPTAPPPPGQPCDGVAPHSSCSASRAMTASSKSWTLACPCLRRTTTSASPSRSAQPRCVPGRHGV